MTTALDIFAGIAATVAFIAAVWISARHLLGLDRGPRGPERTDAVDGEFPGDPVEAESAPPGRPLFTLFPPSE